MARTDQPTSLPKTWYEGTVIHGTYRGVPFDARIGDCRFVGRTSHVFDLYFLEPIETDWGVRQFTSIITDPSDRGRPIADSLCSIYGWTHPEKVA